MPVIIAGRHTKLRQHLSGFYAETFQGVWYQESIRHPWTCTLPSVMDGKYVDDRHLAAAGLVLYRNIFGICQQVAGQRCTLYGFRHVARCAGAFATTHYCISFYQIQLSATHRVHTFHRKFTAFCRYTYGFPVYPV